MSNLKDRIHQIMSRDSLASLATITEDGKPWVRYVSFQPDENLVLRFSTFKSSRKVGQIGKNPEVHMTLGANSAMSMEPYIQVQGKARVLTDEATKQAFWRPELKVYFQEPTNPEYCVVEVRPYRIEVWSVTAGQPEVWEG